MEVVPSTGIAEPEKRRVVHRESVCTGDRNVQGRGIFLMLLGSPEATAHPLPFGTVVFSELGTDATSCPMAPWAPFIGSVQMLQVLAATPWASEGV